MSFAGKGLAAAALSAALQLGPIHQALANEFNLLRDGPPTATYVADDAGVLNRVTRSDLKRLLSDLEERTGFHIDLVTLRKLTVTLVLSSMMNMVPSIKQSIWESWLFCSMSYSHPRGIQFDGQNASISHVRHMKILGQSGYSSGKSSEI